MDNNSKKYLAYLQNPGAGLVELYSIAKHRLLGALSDNLNKSSSLNSLTCDSSLLNVAL